VEFAVGLLDRHGKISLIHPVEGLTQYSLFFFLPAGPLYKDLLLSRDGYFVVSL
jgi:hypothetical protein